MKIVVEVNFFFLINVCLDYWVIIVCNYAFICFFKTTSVKVFSVAMVTKVKFSKFRCFYWHFGRAKACKQTHKFFEVSGFVSSGSTNENLHN